MTNHAPEALLKTKKLVEEIRYCMMTTLTPEGAMTSRPMTVLRMDDQGNLWFFADEDSEQTVAFDMDDSVNLAFACPEKSKYLSIVGTAKVLKDRAKIDELWNAMAAAWFPEGKDDPAICLIQVHPHSAEYWESTNSKVVQLLGVAKAILGGKRFDTGVEHGKVNC